MSSEIRLFVLMVALLATPSLAIGAQATSINGWGNYKFGMTPKQARAVPGVQWKPFKISELVFVEVGTMEAITPANVFGSSLKIELTFDPDKLVQIELNNKMKATSRSECVSSYETLLLSVEKEYGIFSPPPRSANSKDNVIEAAKQLRDGSSRYLLYSSEGLFSTRSRITLGEGKISVNMSYLPTEATGCERSISFNPS